MRFSAQRRCELFDRLGLPAAAREVGKRKELELAGRRSRIRQSEAVLQDAQMRVEL